MNLSDNIWMHYLELPCKQSEPVKINRILEQRIKRHRYVRDLRLTSLERE